MDYFDIDSEEILPEEAFTLEDNKEAVKLNIAVNVKLPTFICSKDFEKHFPKEGFLGSNDHTRWKIFPSDGLLVFSEAHILKHMIADANVTIQTIKAGLDQMKEIPENRPSYFDLRLNVTRFLYSLRNSIDEWNDTVDTELTTLVETIGPIKSSSISSDGCLFQLYHGQLEWRWLCLTSYLNVNNEVEFNKILLYTVYDLMVIALKTFRRTENTYVLDARPYQCSCFYEMWILVQILLEKNRLPFWVNFNQIATIIEHNNTIYNELNAFSMMRENQPLIEGNFYIFALWMMNEIAKLHFYNEIGEKVGEKSLRVIDNFEYFEKLTVKFLATNPNEQNLRLYLCLTIKLTKIWQPKFDIVMAFWDHFHRHLNSSSIIPGSVLSESSLSNLTAKDFLDDIKQSIGSRNDGNLNNTSFMLFVNLLTSLIENCNESGQSNVLMKTMGRIYSRLPSTKLVALNEAGILKIGQLLLTLAMITKNREINKIGGFLQAISLDKIASNRLSAISKVQMAFIIVSIENSIEVKDHIQELISQFNSLVSMDSENLTNSKIVMGVLIQNFAHLFLELENPELGQQYLFDDWLRKYLDRASPSELDRFLGVIEKILMKYGENPLNKIRCGIFKYILPFLKSKSSTLHDLPHYSQLMTSLCLTSTIDGSDGNPKFFDMIQFCIKINYSNHIEDFIKCFWLRIIKSPRINLIENRLILKNWFKCCFFANDGHEILDQFSHHLLTLDEFRPILELEKKIIGSKFPHHSFLESVGLHFQKLTDCKQKANVIELLHYILADFDNWTKVLATKSREIVIRIYKTIGKIFLYCSQLIYMRSKSDCFFDMAMVNFILPLSLKSGKIPEPNHTQSIHLIYPLLIEGLSKLDYRNDYHIKQSLNDLIVKWTPYFRAVSSKPEYIAKPYIFITNGCNQHIVEVVFEVLVTNFIRLPKSRQPPTSACLAITIFVEIFKNIQDNEERLKWLLNTTTIDMMEHALKCDDIVPSKMMIFDFFDLVFGCLTFRSSNDLRDLIINILKTVTKNNLSYYTLFYFQFMNKIAKANPIIVKELLCFIRSEIDVIEEIRMTNTDGHLRNSLQILENFIISSGSVV